MKIGNRKRKRTHEHKNKVIDPYYQSRGWKSLVDSVWYRDDHLCQECLRQGHLKPLTRPSKDIVYQGHADHIIPRDRGGKDVMDNLELLCYHCHATKSNQERRPQMYGDMLINVIGNIAAGKTTISKALAMQYNAEYFEINTLKKNTNPIVVLESSGIGWKINYIKKRFFRVVTILVQCDYSETLARLKDRVDSGYVYPNNRLTPIEFYNNVLNDLSSVDHDVVVDTTDGCDINKIISTLQGGGWFNRS